MVDLSGTKCQAGTGVSVAQVPEPRPRVSSRCRIHAVKHEPEFHKACDGLSCQICVRSTGGLPAGRTA